MVFDDAGAVTNGFGMYSNSGTRMPTISGLLGNDAENRLHRVMGTLDGTNARFYCNGRLAETVANTTIPTADTDRQTELGAHWSTASNSSTRTAMLLAMAWDRVLTIAEYRQLYNNPWSLFFIDRPIFVSSVVGGGGGSSIAPILNYYRMLRSQ